MDGDELFTLLFILAGVGLGLACLIGITASNESDWTKTEDPACYLHVYKDKHLITEDTTTRTRYCEVP